MSDFLKENTFQYKLIYVFSIPDDRHNALLKVGDTTIKSELSLDKLYPNSIPLRDAARDRIDKETKTAGIEYKLLYTELAVYRDGDTLKTFRDYDVHKVLENSGYKKHNFGKEKGYGKEWYKVELETIKKAISAVKNNKVDLLNSDKDKKEHTPIVLRKEQNDAVERTIKHFKKSNIMLWNAKMRFGKTVTALELVKREGYEKTIIITHRPVVDDGWYDDFINIFYNDNEYEYGSKSRGKDLKYLLNDGKKFVYFSSIQDLRGSSFVGGKYNKNNDVFDTIWDLVIVDEAHEGTKTALGDEVIKKVVKEGAGKTKFLALSGTPFNIIQDYDKESTFTWDYVMEQKAKREWDENNFGDHNPYSSLPELCIYTYDISNVFTENKKYAEFEDKAFNFHEFFRVCTGNVFLDGEVDKNVKVGEFVHKKDVWIFLNLLTKEDNDNMYPFSNEKYRNMFHHTFWMVPGVKEAKALEEMMYSHPVFGSGLFEIVNVAGNGDDEDEDNDALIKVRKALERAGDNGYTITLSCGKLTTGVTVPEWSAVFMLSGSYSTSATTYLQAIFRSQTPCSKYGKVKTHAYVFDFAPDRTLKMIATSLSIGEKAGETKDDDRNSLKEFLNFCPIISISGTKMKEINTSSLLQTLKKIYAERAVINGFDDSSIYSDNLLSLSDVEIKEFNTLKGIIGKTKAQEKANEVEVNRQGFTNVEYDGDNNNRKKDKKELEIEYEKKKKQRRDAISILRGISIRLPLLIYGADVDINEDFTIEMLFNDDVVDPNSWAEFMPKGVTKEYFKNFIKYYDKDVFISAGRKIRELALLGDNLMPKERVKKIAELFSYFRNPDKETVLTPWKVVNMHLSSTIGGYDFFDKDHKTALEDSPRFTSVGNVTTEVLLNDKSIVLEINSKTGLYPLYVTYSLFRTKLNKIYPDGRGEELSARMQNLVWDEIVKNNIFVITKTEMAKDITRRTLMGYRKGVANIVYVDNLINVLNSDIDSFTTRVLSKSFWNKGDDDMKMKFDAVVGNPPYQMKVNAKEDQQNATAIYQLFMEAARKIEPKYISLIMPSRWMTGGRGLDDFRKKC